MPKWNFVVVLDSNEYQTFGGFLCFLIRNIFWSLVVYFTHLAPYVHFSCLVHALHIATSYTQPPLVHTFATLVMPWYISCFLILAYHVYFILCSILFLRCFCLLVELHFLIYLVHLMYLTLVHIFFSFLSSSWFICLFMTKRRRVY